MSSIPHDSDLDSRAISPVLGCLEPVWKTAAPFQHAGWRWLQCTKTPNEYKVLIPPKLANDYALLLETEQTELVEENVDWEYVAYLRRLKKRMINRASKLERDHPPHHQSDGSREIRAPACFRLKQIEKWARATEAGQRKPTPEKHWHQCPEIVRPLQHDAPYPQSQTTILDQPDRLSPNRVQLDSTYRPLTYRHGSLMPLIMNSPETVSLVQDVRPTSPNGDESLFELHRNSSSNGDSLYQSHQIPRLESSPNREAHPPNPIMTAIFVDKQVQTDNGHTNKKIAMSSEPPVRTRSVHRRIRSPEKPSISEPRLFTTGLPSGTVIDEDSVQPPRTHTDSNAPGTLFRGVTSSSLGKFPIPLSSPMSPDSIEAVRRPLSDPLPRKSHWKHHTIRSHRSPAKSGPSGSPRADDEAQGDNKDVSKRSTTIPRPSDASQSSEGRGSAIRKMENPFISGNTHRLLTPPREKSNSTTKSLPTSVKGSNKVSLQEDLRDGGGCSFVPDPVAPSHHDAPPSDPALVKDTHSSESHSVSQQAKPKHRVPPSAPRRGLYSTSVYPGTQNPSSKTLYQPPPIYQTRRTDVRSVTSAGVPTGQSDAAPPMNADRAFFSRAQIASFASFELQPLDSIRISVGSKGTSNPSMPPTPTKSDNQHKRGSHSSMDATPKSAHSETHSLQSITLEPLKNVVRMSSRSIVPRSPNIVPKTTEAKEPREPTLPSSPGILKHGRRSASSTMAPAANPTRSPISSPIAAPPPANPVRPVPSSPVTLNHGRRSAFSSRTAPALNPRRSPIFPPSPQVAASPPDSPLRLSPTLLRSSIFQCHPLSPMTVADLEATKRPSRKTTLLSLLRKAFRKLRRRRSVRWVAGIKDGIIGSDFSSRPHSLSQKSSSERDLNAANVRRTPLKRRIVMEEEGVTFSLVFPPKSKATRKPRVDPSLPQ